MDRTIYGHIKVLTLVDSWPGAGFATGCSMSISINMAWLYKVRSRPVGDCPLEDNSGRRGDESAIKNFFCHVGHTWTTP